MGMFDTLHIDISQLPITKEQANALPENPDWQTKDLDCTLTDIYITTDGELEIIRFDSGLEDLNKKTVKLNYHGYVHFYDILPGGEWVEFRAKFTDGKLDKIETLEFPV